MVGTAANSDPTVQILSEHLSPEWPLGGHKKNPAHGRVLSFRGSGGVICTVPTAPTRVRLK